MLDHAAEATEIARGRSRSDLDTDRLLNLALVRLIEIVGEAASRVASEVQERYAEIPWADIVGMRNRVVHGYDEVDFDILWDVVDLHLPPLIAELRRAIAAFEPPERPTK
jgi:uncharacterized protein with HEPN domain